MAAGTNSETPGKCRRTLKTTAERRPRMVMKSRAWSESGRLYFQSEGISVSHHDQRGEREGRRTRSSTTISSHFRSIQSIISLANSTPPSKPRSLTHLVNALDSATNCKKADLLEARSMSDQLERTRVRRAGRWRLANSHCTKKTVDGTFLSGVFRKHVK